MFNRCHIVSIALSLAIACTAASAQMVRPMPASAAHVEAIHGKDDREVQSRSAFPFIVRLLDENQRFICTGSVIGSHTVLTAAHCTGFRDGRFPSSRWIGFVETADGVRYRVRRSCVSPEYGGVDDNGLLHRTDITPDIALLVTERRLPVPTVAVDRNLADGERVWLAGYHGDRPNLLLVNSCVAERFDSVLVWDRVQHRCDSVAGSSGSPILAKKHGVIVLVGVHSSSAYDGSTSFAALIGGETAVDDFIAEGLARDPAAVRPTGAVGLRML